MRSQNIDVFRRNVYKWLCDCLGVWKANDKKTRVYRFLEEALELAQATGCSREDALALVDYVYNREPGVVEQEIGGVMLTLAGLSSAIHAPELSVCMNNELDRVIKNIDKIRLKDSLKPNNSPLPGNIDSH